MRIAAAQRIGNDVISKRAFNDLMHGRRGTFSIVDRLWWVNSAWTSTLKLYGLVQSGQPSLWTERHNNDKKAY
jgi:hypothetical protein